MAEVCGAPEMMDVRQAHIDACGLLTDSGLEFSEKVDDYKSEFPDYRLSCIPRE